MPEDTPQTPGTTILHHEGAYSIPSWTTKDPESRDYGIRRRTRMKIPKHPSGLPGQMMPEVGSWWDILARCCLLRMQFSMATSYSVIITLRSRYSCKVFAVEKLMGPGFCCSRYGRLIAAAQPPRILRACKHPTQVCAMWQWYKGEFDTLEHRVKGVQTSANN